MKNYVRIDGGLVMELLSTDLDITTMFHPDLIWIDVTTLDPSPQQGWTATKSKGKWTFSAPTDAI